MNQTEVANRLMVNVFFISTLFCSDLPDKVRSSILSVARQQKNLLKSIQFLPLYYVFSNHGCALFVEEKWRKAVEELVADRKVSDKE